MDVPDLLLLCALLLLLYLLVLLFHELLHSLTSDYRYLSWILDLLASLELTASTIVLAVVYSRHSFLIFVAVALIHLSIISKLSYDRRFPGRSSVTHTIRAVLLGGETVVSACVCCLAMVVGACVASAYLLPAVVRVATDVLSLSVSVDNPLCGAAKGTDLWRGVLIEAVATVVEVFILRFLTRRDSRHLDLAGGATRLFAYSKIPIVLRGMVSTGAYANSVLATGVNFPCGDVVSQHFLMTYWLGPVLGMAAAMILLGEMRGLGRRVRIM